MHQKGIYKNFDALQLFDKTLFQEFYFFLFYAIIGISFIKK